jgi:Holliday junction resolvase RusA-like endonuclease
MKTIRFKMFLTPHPKARPRFGFVVMGGIQAVKSIRSIKDLYRFIRVTAYTEAKDKAAEKVYHAEIATLQIFEPGERIAGPIALQARFVFKRPDSHLRQGKVYGLLKPSAPIFHTVKPDIDNLEKFLFDILNEYISDDKAIYRTESLKQWAEYGEPEHTEVILLIG